MKGTEILNGGKVLCSSSCMHCEWVGYEGKHYLLPLLGYSGLSQGPEFHVLSELEQTSSWLAGRELAAEFPALALFSMCCYIPDCTLIVRPFLQWTIQQNCMLGLLSHVLLFPNTVSVPESSEWFPLLPLLFWGPKRSYEAPIPLRHHMSHFLQLLPSWHRTLSSVCTFFCVCWAQVPLGPGGARWWRTFPSFSDSSKTSASHSHTMSPSVVRQKSPISWS